MESIITWQQYAKHVTGRDCWVLIDGYVYNVSDYMVEHPGGDQILTSGTDASIPFNKQMHTDYAKSLRNARLVGKIEDKPCTIQYLEKLHNYKNQIIKQKKIQAKKSRKIRKEILKKQVSLHRSEEDCWIIIDGNVYDVTDYLQQHPGGVHKIMDYAGKDATKAFRDAGHSLQAIQKKKEFLVGSLAKQSNIIILILLLSITLGVVWYYLTYKA